jgi:hypothetical protein
MNLMTGNALDTADLLRSATLRSLVVAGFTGRDESAVRAHVKELEEHGIAPPAQTPCFYRLGPNLLTVQPHVDVVGSHSSGEAEAVLVAVDGRLYVGVGSDHTDRAAEAYDITLSKQLCPKPLGPLLWPLADVLDHWDQLVLRSYRHDSQGRELYQEGSTESLLPPLDLVRRLTDGPRLPDGTVLFCGTLPVIGAIRGAERLDIELFDPVRSASISHSYRVNELPLPR